jgi:hypothetical protein
MSGDWDTIYREGDIASEAGTIVGKLWIGTEPGTEEEDFLCRVRQYLHDRAMVAYEFCEIVTGLRLSDPNSYECDIPF